MRIAEIHADLGIKQDKESFRQADNSLKRLTREAGKAGEEAGRGFWSKLWGGGKGARDARGRFTGGGTKGLRGALLGAGSSGMSRMVGLGAGAVGGFATVKTMKDELAWDDQLTQLGISARGAMGSLDLVRQSVLDVSSATSVAKEEITQGAQSFLALTGDGKTASDTMMTFARVQRATGAETEAIAQTAAALNQQLGIMGPEMEQAFSILAAGGKAGAVEFKDMASLMSSLAASFKGFGASQGLGGVSQLGAMFQIVRKDFGSASEAATGMERLMESLSSPRTLKAFKQLGIEVFQVGQNGRIQFKPMADILDQMGKSKLISDPKALNLAFESSEARRAARAILQNSDAVKQLALDTSTAKDIAEDYATRQESASARVAKSWNEVKVHIDEALNTEKLANFASAVDTITQRELALAEAAGKVFHNWFGQEDDEDRMLKKGALSDFKRKTGLTNEQIAGMDPFEISNRRRAAGDSTAPWDIAEGGASTSLRETAQKEAQFDAKLATDRAERQNSLQAIADRYAYKPQADQADAIRGGATFNITVNAPPGADAQDYARILQESIGFHWNNQMRNAAASR